jgi:hypothetical protein
MNKKDSKWIKNFRKLKGRKNTIDFNFEKFMTHTLATVEDIALALGYSVNGTIAMLKRGTVKKNTLDKLSKRWPSAKSYIVTSQK